MKKHRKEEVFLEELRKLPIVSIACDRVCISRNSVYKWYRDDPNFKVKMDEAIQMGEYSITDLAEAGLIKHLKAEDKWMIKYWLDNHKRNYIRPRRYFDRIKENDFVDQVLIKSGIINEDGTPTP